MLMLAVASNQLGEFEAGATAALFGAVPSVVGGGVATVLLAVGWNRAFPALAAREKPGPEAPPAGSRGLR